MRGTVFIVRKIDRASIHLQRGLLWDDDRCRSAYTVHISHQVDMSRKYLPRVPSPTFWGRHMYTMPRLVGVVACLEITCISRDVACSYSFFGQARACLAILGTDWTTARCPTAGHGHHQTCGPSFYLPMKSTQMSSR
jgi:hypothetical protein